MASNENRSPQKLGPYELVRRIATGGMAEVYQARREGPHGFTKTVALKRILPQLARDDDFLEMFIDEARVCAQLSHPNLVQVFDFGEADGELYMAMEFVDGTNCAKAVRKAASRRQMIPVDVVVYIILSVLRGLGYAHDAVDMEGLPLGLVHRDVSPGNILLAKSGAVKLSDFGIARANDFKSRTEEGQLKGKLGYMSPEQVTGGTLDARSDLFTLGIVMAELLTARPLFGTQNELDVLLRIRDADISSFERHNDHLPEPLIEITRRALAQDPNDRFQTASEFGQALEEFVRVNKLGAGSSHLARWLLELGLVEPHRSGEIAGVRRYDRSRSSSTRSARVSGSRHRVSSGSMTAAYRGARGASSQEIPAQEPKNYKVASGDKVLGPLSYADVVELFVLGRGRADTLVCREAGPFRPAREFQEFARTLNSVVGSGDLPGDDEKLQRTRWDLNRLTMPQKLFEIVQRKDTGVLVARSGAKHKRFYFLDGNPSYITSTEREELLGQQLIAQGLVNELQVDMALSLSPRYGGRLGDVLVERIRALRPVELIRALNAQLRVRFRDLLSWRSGDIEFIYGVRTDTASLVPDISMPSAIANVVQHVYQTGELEIALQSIEKEKIKKVVVPNFTIDEMHLPAHLEQVLNVVQDGQTVEQVWEEVPPKLHVTRDDVSMALFLGLSSRVLVVTAWPPRTQMASAPTIVR